MRPVNEIHEPVFYPLDYVAAEALAGGEFSRDSAAGPREPAFLFEPRVAFEKNVNPWAGFSFWPLYWNFLLTGDPNDAGGNPEEGKLNLAAHGGLDGIGYSTRDGWFLSAAVGLRGKYLLDEKTFLKGDLQAGIADLAAPEKFQGSLESGLGYQATPIHSLLATYALILHKAFRRRPRQRAPPGAQGLPHAQPYRGGGNRLRVPERGRGRGGLFPGGPQVPVRGGIARGRTRPGPFNSSSGDGGCPTG
jgi:hypothetical protein